MHNMKKIKRCEIMRPTLENFKKKALSNPEVSKEYHEFSPAYELRKKIIKLRKDAGLTQCKGDKLQS